MRSHRSNIVSSAVKRIAAARGARAGNAARRRPAVGNSTWARARRTQAGETIVETLCALTVAGLAGIILVMAIGSAASIVQTTSDAAEGYYESENALAGNGAETKPGEAVITNSLSGTSLSIPVQVTQEDEPGLSGDKVVSYRATPLSESGATP